MEDSLKPLLDGRSVHVAYDTTFFIDWPEHLGGGTVNVDFEGTFVMIPVLSAS